MRNFLIVCTITFAMALTTACDSETIVTKVDKSQPGTQRGDGVLFSLPETLVVAEVPMTRLVSAPGAFSNWTPFFYPELKTDDYVTEQKTAFKLGTPTFNTRGQTDPDNVYIAHIKAKRFETKTLLLEFNEDGIIARTEASSKDDTIDIITSSAKTVATIVGPLLRGGAPAANVQPAISPTKTEAQNFREYFLTLLEPPQKAFFLSREAAYHDVIRDHFGYDFVVYLITKEDADQNKKAATIDLLLTLNDRQIKVVKEHPDHTTGPCVEGNAGTKCLAPQAKIEFVKAKAAYEKIQELRRKREELLNEQTPPQVQGSAHLEFRLKEIDGQIKNFENTYFFGASAETSATAKFEFKPTSALPAKDLFTYAAGGSKPGICVVSDEAPGVFKAVWPKNLKGSCHGPNPLFEPGDFRDLDELANKLKKGAPGAGGDAVSSYIYSRLTPGTRGKVVGPLNTPQQKADLTRALIADFNAILNGGSLFTAAPALFDPVELSASTIELMRKAAPTAAEIVQLNRSFMEDAYAKELYRFSASTGRAVKLSVDSMVPGFAQTVMTASLKQDGKRGFPYRIAVPTLARISDDGTEKSRSPLKIAQFGPVQTLPASLGGRRSSYKITYFDSTGAIKVFDMSADALIQKQNITDLADAATILRDSEAAALKRETELLELKKKRLEAEKALKEAQGEPTP